MCVAGYEQYRTRIRIELSLSTPSNAPLQLHERARPSLHVHSVFVIAKQKPRPPAQALAAPDRPAHSSVLAGIGGRLLDCELSPSLSSRSSDSFDAPDVSASVLSLPDSPLSQFLTRQV